MTKSRLILSEKIQRLARRGVRGARHAAKKAGVPVPYVVNGKLTEVRL